MGKDVLVQQLVDSFDSWPAKNSGCGSSRMTQELYPFDKLFSPIKINKLTVKNRIVMAPMGNIDMCEETGRPSDMMLQYFFARAKGGCGLITTGLVPVSHSIDTTVTELDKLTYFPRIDRSRTVMAGWRDLAQGVHAFGSRILSSLRLDSAAWATRNASSRKRSFRSRRVSCLTTTSPPFHACASRTKSCAVS